MTALQSFVHHLQSFCLNVTKLRSGTCYRKSVCRLPDCRVSVTFVHPPQSVEISFFYAILYPGHPSISIQNFTEIVTGEFLRLGLNTREVGKYNDVRYVEGYDLETEQDTASNTI